jgi:hypothetical protein
MTRTMPTEKDKKQTCCTPLHPELEVVVWDHCRHRHLFALLLLHPPSETLKCFRLETIVDPGVINVKGSDFRSAIELINTSMKISGIDHDTSYEKSSQKSIKRVSSTFGTYHFSEVVFFL